MLAKLGGSILAIAIVVVLIQSATFPLWADILLGIVLVIALVTVWFRGDRFS